MFPPESHDHDLRKAVLAYFKEEDIQPEQNLNVQYLAMAAGISFDYPSQTWELDE